jgi:hypothetical protein
MRIVIIVVMAMCEDIARELVTSFLATRDLVRYRLQWIVRDKVRSIWRRARHG